MNEYSVDIFNFLDFSLVYHKLIIIFSFSSQNFCISFVQKSVFIIVKIDNIHHFFYLIFILVRLIMKLLYGAFSPYSSAI